MFRRSKSEPEPTPATVEKVGGKGRPTPKRKDAEAAARARAKTPRTRKEMAKATREARAESGRKMREAMRTGDDRYLPARDRGPVRRFVRDFVDVRLSYIEVLVPVVLAGLIAGFAGLQTLASYANSALFALLLVLVFNLTFMVRRLNRELRERFPDGDLSGTTWYAVSRSMQMKFMRLPKSRVKLGQPLPDDYHR